MGIMFFTRKIEMTETVEISVELVEDIIQHLAVLRARFRLDNDPVGAGLVTTQIEELKSKLPEEN